MWNVCRAAALQQLRRSVATSSPAALALASRHAITTAAPRAVLAHHFTNVAGVDRDFILSRSAKELRVELGNAKIVRVQQALGKELEDVLAKDDVSPEEIKDIFTAAQKTKATRVMLRAFEFMHDAFPSRVDFAMLGEIFRILMRARDGEKLFAVYETLRARFQSTPEMVYRFGIVGKLELGDLDGANAIWDEMLDAGHATPNEVSSRMLQAYARAGDRDRALEIFHSLDPQLGQWHESAIDRVILSLGVLGEPQLAFDFYVNSSMKLNGGTLMALLSVCVSNNCHQQAADILANRKRFDLHLDARAYNRILTTLEFLGHHAELRDVLEEMQARNTRFDSMTRTIIARNASHLEGTPFVHAGHGEGSDDDAISDADSSHSHGGNKKPSSFFAAPRIRELLKQGDAKQAAALVDEYVKPLLPADVPAGTVVPDGALKVPALLAADAVRAYMQTGNDAKVAQLVQTFSTVEGNYGQALAAVMMHYGVAGTGGDAKLAYTATKALLFQGRQIFRVDDALALFRKFRDVTSTATLFTQVIDEFAASKQAPMEQSQTASDVVGLDADAAAAATPLPLRKRFSTFNLGRVVNMTLQTFVEARELDRALAALDALAARSLPPTAFNYAVVLSTMREQNSAAARTGKQQQQRNSRGKSKRKAAVYDADAFERVLADMRSRGVAVNKSIVGNVCVGLAGGAKRQRLLLLEAYAEARSVAAADKYVLPTACYTTLLQTAAQDGSAAELQALYDDAVASLGDAAAGRVPRDWTATLVAALLASHDVDAAHKLLLTMPQLNGAIAYEPLVAVLRAVATAGDRVKTAELLEALEAHTFRLNLSDAYDLVHVARDTNQPQLALEAVRLFEVAHVDETRDELHGVRLADMHVATKLRTMYRVTLNVCEQNGQWKNALRLRERVAKLLGEDAIADVTNDKPVKAATAATGEHDA